MTGTHDKQVGEKTYTRASLAVRYTKEIYESLKAQEAQHQEQQGGSEGRSIAP